LLTLLQANDVALLVDVRTVPRSRRHPHFNRDELSKSLPAHNISYLHLPALGGLRKPNKDSLNAGWRNESFRGYADYMQTADFNRGLDELMSIGSCQQTVIMCAEAVPWRCHRSLISDALTARGVAVEHITGPGARRPHEMTSFARVDGTRVTYPASDQLLLPMTTL
jgi:uncharacterized protein (DUF488 family)